MRRSVLALAAALSAVASAAPADAKPFTYTDAKDQPANAGLDVVGVKWATEGVTTVTKSRGRRVKTYEPTKLVVTLTMAGAPVVQPGIRYRTEAQIAECGDITFTYVEGVASSVLSLSQLSVGCGGPAGTTGGDTLFVDPKFGIKGNSMTWSVPLKALPKVARAGALLFNFESSVDLTEPGMGSIGPGDFGDGLFDTASGADADWELS